MIASTRIVLVGGPRSGKSSYARRLRDEQNIPTYCCDPRSTVKEPEHGVTYLPENLGWEGASAFIAGEWLRMPGPYCVEGHATARALRKLVQEREYDAIKGLRVVVFGEQIEDAITAPGQRALAKGVFTVWREIAWAFPNSEERRAA